MGQIYGGVIWEQVIGCDVEDGTTLAVVFFYGAPEHGRAQALTLESRTKQSGTLDYRTM